MSQEINCAVIADLLPLYAEGLSGQETARLVEAHLADCPACREKYQQMRAAPPVGAGAEKLEALRPLRRLRFHVVMNILGFPLWLPLLLVGVLLATVLYVCAWAVLAALWCIPLALAACLPGGIFAAVSFAVRGLAGNAVIFLGAGLAGAGLAVGAFFPCLWLTRQLIRFTRFLWRKCTGRTRREKEKKRHV